jgi:hypothetical protein
VIPTLTAALGALDVEHTELADEVAENDGAFTRHSASQFLRDSGAAAMSSAAWILLQHPRALVWYVRRRM